MKRLTRLGVAALCAGAIAVLAGCGKDESAGAFEPGQGEAARPNPAAVFAGGFPQKVDKLKINVGADGLVQSITSLSKNVVFEYGNISRSGTPTTFQVMMTYDETFKDADCSVFYFQLNEMGYVKYALQEHASGGTDEWHFGYNAEGQLSGIRRSEENETVTITYDGGDIVRVKSDRLNDGSDITETLYTSRYQDSIMANEGAVMLFEYTFNINIEEMAMAYYAGLLGKATSHLPVAVVDKFKDESQDTLYFQWLFNDTRKPVQCIIGKGYKSISFRW